MSIAAPNRREGRTAERRPGLPLQASAHGSTAVTNSLWRRTGWGVSWFISLFMLFDGGARAAGFAPYIQGLVESGYPIDQAVPIGLSLVISTILYLLPRTAIFGALLVTGYLGGAVATQVRIEDAWFLFPVFCASLVWIGLALRDPRVKTLLLQAD